MYIINSHSNKYFTFNGVQYLKNYTSRVSGEKVAVFNTYDNKDVLIEFKHYSEFSINGFVLSSAAAVQQALLPVIYSRGTLGNDVPEILQDNVDKIKTVRLFEGTGATVLSLVNALPSYSVSETESVWFRVSIVGFGGFEPTTPDIPIIAVTKVDIYKMVNKGKGSYGIGQTQLTSADLLYVSTQQITQNDIISAPETQQIDFGNISTEDYVDIADWLNQKNPSVAIQGQEEGYVLFSGSIDSLEVSYLWKAGSGTYGLGQTQSSITDFQLLDSEKPGASLQDVVMNGSNAFTPDSVSITSGRNTNFSSFNLTPDGFSLNFRDKELTFSNSVSGTNMPFSVGAAVNPQDAVQLDQAAKGFDLPEDFLCFGRSTSAYSIRYKTDIWRTFNIGDIIPAGTPNRAFNEIVRNGNDIICIASGSFTSASERPLIVTLKEARIKDNKFRYIGGYELTTVNTDLRIHASLVHNGFVYLATRSHTLQSNQIIKINPNDLFDQKVYTFPMSMDVSGVNSLEGYKDGIYMLAKKSIVSPYTSYLIKFDENLENLTILDSWVENFERQSQGYDPLLIYNEHIYTVSALMGTIENYKKFRVYIYSLSGKLLKRSNILLVSDTFIPTTPMIAHWMTAFNGKLIFTTSREGGIRQVIRVDIHTLQLEENLQMDTLITDDNTITRDGYLYLGSERNGDVQIFTHKIKYNDFTDHTLEDENKSSASIEYKWYNKEAFTPATLTQTSGFPVILSSKVRVLTSVVGSADGTTEKLLATIFVPAGTVATGQYINFNAVFTTSGSGIAAGKTVRLKTNSSKNLTDAAVMATFNMAAATRYASFERISIDIGRSVGGAETIRAYGAGISTSTDNLANGSAAYTNIPFDTTTDNYFFITGQLANATDDITLDKYLMITYPEK